MPRLFCFGLGYTALALARSAAADGWSVAGTCRGEDKRRALADAGFDAYLFDRDAPLADPTAALAGTTHIVSSVPPDGAGDPVLDHHGADLAALSNIAWAGYLSTTGVYGDRGGDWVDESAPLTPTGPRGRRRLAAEEGWLSLWRDGGLPVHLFRLAGIYGPGRSALDTVRAGRARRIDKPGQVFNRIHVDDIVTVLRASMAAAAPGTAYNCADDDPAPSNVVIAHACALLGVETPPLISFNEAKGTMSAMAASFYDDNKRVANGRLKDALGVTLAYPSYRDGLAAQLAAEGASAVPGQAVSYPPS